MSTLRNEIAAALESLRLRVEHDGDHLIVSDEHDASVRVHIEPVSGCLSFPGDVTAARVPQRENAR